MRAPAGALRPGHTYRARVRLKDATGRSSFWSEPLPFVTTTPDVSISVNALRISGINYHPGVPTAAEVAAPGWNPLWNEQGEQGAQRGIGIVRVKYWQKIMDPGEAIQVVRTVAAGNSPGFRFPAAPPLL